MCVLRLKLSFTKFLVNPLSDVWYVLLGEGQRFFEGEPLAVLQDKNSTVILVALLGRSLVGRHRPASLKILKPLLFCLTGQVFQYFLK